MAFSEVTPLITYAVIMLDNVRVASGCVFGVSASIIVIIFLIVSYPDNHFDKKASIIPTTLCCIPLIISAVFLTFIPTTKEAITIFLVPEAVEVGAKVMDSSGVEKLSSIGSSSIDLVEAMIEDKLKELKK